MRKLSSILFLALFLIVVIVIFQTIYIHLGLQKLSKKIDLHNKETQISNNNTTQLFSKIDRLLLDNNTFTTELGYFAFNHPDFFKASECDVESMREYGIKGLEYGDGWQSLARIDLSKENCVPGGNGGVYGSVKIYKILDPNYIEYKNRFIESAYEDYLKSRLSTSAYAITVSTQKFENNKISYTVTRNDKDGKSMSLFGVPIEEHFFFYGNYVVNASIRYEEYYGLDQVENAKKAFNHMLETFEFRPLASWK
jgi:hypothetical protein